MAIAGHACVHEAWRKRLSTLQGATRVSGITLLGGSSTGRKQSGCSSPGPWEGPPGQHPASACLPAGVCPACAAGSRVLSAGSSGRGCTSKLPGWDQTPAQQAACRSGQAACSSGGISLSNWREALVVQNSVWPCQHRVAGSCTDSICAAAKHSFTRESGMAAHAVQHKAASYLLHPEGILNDKPDQSIIGTRWDACMVRGDFQVKRLELEHSSCKATNEQQWSFRAGPPTIGCC